MRIATILCFGAGALTACTTRTATGPTQGVLALAGYGVAEGGATIIAQTADGTVLDEQTADATGQAAVAYEPGAYVTAIFPALIDPLPTSITVVTTPETGGSGDLVIHGPPEVEIANVVAGLTVDGSAEPGAASYSIDLGCSTQTSAVFPAAAAIIAACESDQLNVDVLVQALDGSGTMLGYGAGRVPIGTDQAGNSAADLEVDTWQTTGIMVPVTDGTGSASIALSLVSDYLSFDTPAVANGQAMIWNGLVVDGWSVYATLGGDQITTQYGSGTPAAIAIGSADFLGDIGAPALADTESIGATWPAVAVAGPDALDLYLTWQGSNMITWHAVLPPDATAIDFPQLDATTSQVITLPSDPSMVTGALTAIDSSALDGFAALQAAGIYEYDQIVPTPGSGEIRTSAAALP